MDFNKWCMKKCFTVLMILLTYNSIHAQTWEEWTKQKKTQIKYLLEQIVAFRAYDKQLKAGYDIVQQGLSTIHRIKQDDFNLHEEFFSSLKRVNPNVRHYTKVIDIILMQANIIKQCKKAIKAARGSEQLSRDELLYLDQIFRSVLDQCITLIDELTKVITNDQLQLSDDERIGRINALYSEMQEHYLFAQNFQKEVTVLATQRIHEQYDVGRMRSLHGLK
jgi:hypothetical protein